MTHRPPRDWFDELDETPAPLRITTRVVLTLLLMVLLYVLW